MTGHSATIPGEWTSELRAALGVFQDLMLEPAVQAAWAHESTIPCYTVGGIAGHVVSLVTSLQRRINSAGADVTIIPYVRWYGAALVEGGVRAQLVETGEELASRGPAKLAGDLEAASDRLAHLLRDARCDLVIPLASIPGAGVRLDDFLRTRFVEITVHADDIASSVGLPSPPFAAEAWKFAASVVSETTSRQGADASFVLAATRPRRGRLDN